MSRPPIVLFVYKRLEHTRRTLRALQRNIGASEHDLIVYSDGPKTENDVAAVESVRSLARPVGGFRSVTILEQERNRGLAASVIAGVTETLAAHGSAIVLEDDLETSPHFLQYMGAGLQRYADDERVISIHGYMYPVSTHLPETFFLRGADCWGWATWRRGWERMNVDGAELLRQLKEKGLTSRFDFNDSYPYTRMLEDQVAGKNSSWAIRWYASAFLEDRLTLYPGRSLVHNVGNDSSGTHTPASTAFDVAVAVEPVNVADIPVAENAAAFEATVAYFRSIKPSALGRVVSGLKRLVDNR